MEILLDERLRLNNESVKLCVDGLIETFETRGGIGRYRGAEYTVSGYDDLDIFESEDLQNQWDYEPILIIKDNGEYGNCYYTLYGSIYGDCEDTFYFDYVYRWKGSLLKESGMVYLPFYANKIELKKIKEYELKEAIKEELLNDLVNSDIWKAYKGE